MSHSGNATCPGWMSSSDSLNSGNKVQRDTIPIAVIFSCCPPNTLAPLEILMLYPYRFKIELGFRQGARPRRVCVPLLDVRMKPLKRGDGDQYLYRTSDAPRLDPPQDGCLPRPCPARMHRVFSAKVRDAV